jgi:hypothetical protein
MPLVKDRSKLTDIDRSRTRSLSPDQRRGAGGVEIQDSNNGAFVLAVAIVALVIVRQLRTRPLRRYSSLIVPAVFGVLGIAAITFGIRSVTENGSLTALPIVLLVLSLPVAAGFGAIRSRTVQLWRGADGVILRKGTLATTGFWVASFAAHLGLGLWIDHAARVGVLGVASLYGYVAIGLGTQNLLLRGRAAAL